MSDATTNLLLPYLLASQAQKHVTLNESLRLLDGLVQMAVIDRDLTAPPVSPADGDRYIVSAGATGDWEGWDLSVALHVDGIWTRLAPRPGWRAWIDDEGLLLVWDGAAWVSILPTELQSMALLGIGTAADGGTGFATGHWGVGESLYVSLVSRANTLFTAHPEFRLGGILWHQGESDSTSEAAANAYASELLALIEGLRSEISAADETTPFIVGDMVPDLSQASYAFQDTVRGVLSGIQALAPYTAFVATADLTDGGDDLHFDAASLRVLGGRYFAAIAVAEAHTEIPTTVSILSAGFAATTEDLSTYSFTVDVGAGGTVAVGVVGRFGFGDAIAANVVVGGVTATLFDYINSANSHVRFAIAVGVPAGTVEIAVTCSGVASRLGIHTWTINGADATGAASVAVNGTLASIDAPAGGAVLAIGASINPASQNIDWTGLAERTEWTNYGDTFGSGAADAELGSASVGHAVEMTTDGNFRQIALLAVPPS